MTTLPAINELVSYYSKRGWHVGRVAKVTIEILPTGRKKAIKIDSANVEPVEKAGKP